MLKQWWEQQPPVTRNLIAITLIVWLVSALARKMGLIDLDNWLGMVNWDWSAFAWQPNAMDYRVGPSCRSFHIWQPVTYMFMHADLSHWFCNMFAVLIFGSAIEREWGSRKYLTYYMVCGIGAALVQQLVWHLASGSYPCVTVGASGAVFGLLLAFGWLFPEQSIFLLFIPVPIRARLFVTIYALFELFAGVLPSQGDNVAHFAHLGGLLFGALLILFWKWWDNHKKNRFKTYENKEYSGFHYKDPIK